MQHLATQQATAINVTTDKGMVHIGVLVLEPNQGKTVKFDEFEIHLTDEAIRNEKTMVLLENDFEVVEGED